MNLRHCLLFPVLIFLAGVSTAQTDSTKSDSLLLQQVSAGLAEQAPPSPPARVAASANPDISVIGDFRGLYRSYGKDRVDAGLSEAEFSFQSVVDPYVRADFYYSVAQDLQTGEFSSEIEEGYLTTLALPAHLQLKAGRFKQAVGRINPVHPHALSFINMPDAYVSFFGEEGLKGDGLSLSWLLPNRAFYQELTFQATEPVESGRVFVRSPVNNFLYLAHLKNFWDLTANATLELGFTGMRGENEVQRMTTLAAADLTYKWKPVQYNTYKAVTFQNEFYYGHTTLGTVTYQTLGFYSLLNVQVAKRWFAGGRYDYTNAPFDEQYRLQSGTITLGWYATEFQKIEIEGKYSNVNQSAPGFEGKRNAGEAFLRWIFVIGTHGAHMY
jgi:hypothetical protein